MIFGRWNEFLMFRSFDCVYENMNLHKCTQSIDGYSNMLVEFVIYTWINFMGILVVWEWEKEIEQVNYK